MKTQIRSLNLSTRILFMLFAGMIFIPHLQAQSAGQSDENRVLLIFDTSSDMKKRLPAEERGIKRLFALSFTTQLQHGDSIGVWTFDRELRAGEFPLQYWQPVDMDIISTNIFRFIEKHRYSRTTSFEQLVPMLERLVASSHQLTTLIFCDGETPIKGTPFDASINSVFRQNQDKMKKLREPFVIVLCSVDGRYIGSTINTAESINVPQFPVARPVPPPPAAPAPVQAPPPSTPPLVIVGTNVGTNVPPAAPAPVVPQQQTAPVPQPTPPPTAAPAISSGIQAGSPMLIVTPPPASPAVETNVASPAAVVTPATISESPTNTVASLVNAVPPASPPAAVAAIGDSSMRKGVLIAVGSGVLIVVFGAGYFILRPRRRGSSLISESLKKR